MDGENNSGERLVRIARYILPTILIGFLVLFTLTSGSTFGSWDNLRAILSTQSVLAVLALACILPLIIGEFDLSVGTNLGLGAILVTGLPSKSGLNVWLAIAVSIAVCGLVGLINGLLIAKAGINAFVVTLGVSSILSGATLWYTGGNAIFTNIPKTLTDLGQKSVAGVPLPVVYLLTIAAVVWYVLEQTPLGRYLYALGGSKEASRLSGLNVESLTVLTFVLTGVLAGVGGVIESAKVGSGNPTIGPQFLLPAFAAAFLGATSIKVGTFNVVGTILGVFTVAVGINGLETLGVPFFVEPIFTGAALVVAVATTRFLRREAL